MIDAEKFENIKNGLVFNINAIENHGAKCTQLAADLEAWQFLLVLLVSYAETACVWSLDGDGVHHTTCRKQFVFDSDGAFENGFAFCPYCRCRIEERCDQSGQ